MSELNTATLTPYLIQMVEEGGRTQFEGQKTLYNRIMKPKPLKYVNGKGWRIPSQFTRPTGITAGSSESFSFNTPTPPEYDDMYTNTSAHALPFEISGRMVRQLKEGASAMSILNDFKSYVADVSEALTKDIERNLPGDGTGTRAKFSSTASTGTSNVTVTCMTTADGTIGSTPGATHLEVNETYDVINASTEAVRGQFTVSSKTGTTVTGNTTGFNIEDAASGDMFVPKGGYKSFAHGLAYHYDTVVTLYQMQSRSNRTGLNPVVVNLGGSAMVTNDFDQMVHLLKIRGDNQQLQSGVCAIFSEAQYAGLRRSGQNLKRLTNSDTRYVGGITEWTYDGKITCFTASDMEEDRVVFPDLDDVGIITEKRFGLYDEDGNAIRMKPGTNSVGSDAHTGAIGVHYDTVATKPRLGGTIKRGSTTGLPTKVAAA